MGWIWTATSFSTSNRNAEAAVCFSHLARYALSTSPRLLRQCRELRGRAFRSMLRHRFAGNQLRALVGRAGLSFPLRRSIDGRVRVGLLWRLPITLQPLSPDNAH